MPKPPDRRHHPKDRAKGHGRPGGIRSRNVRRSNSPPIDETNLIFGLHAAEFALHNQNRAVQAVFATENAERKLAEAIASRGLETTRVSPRDLDKRLGADTVHQGILLEVEPLETANLAELAETAIADRVPILLLDQVTDPHNVGAVLRSCAVFGAAGLVMTRRHSPPLAGTLAKSASGALDLVPIFLAQNLAKAIEELQTHGFKVIGLDGGADYRLLEQGISDTTAAGHPIALVLGAEGKGLRELTRETCNELCRIGGDGPIASLNVSNAAAVALHLAAMQRRQD